MAALRTWSCRDAPHCNDRTRSASGQAVWGMGGGGGAGAALMDAPAAPLLRHYPALPPRPSSSFRCLPPRPAPLLRTRESARTDPPTLGQADTEPTARSDRPSRKEARVRGPMQAPRGQSAAPPARVSRSKNTPPAGSLSIRQRPVILAKPHGTRPPDARPVCRRARAA